MSVGERRNCWTLCALGAPPRKGAIYGMERDAFHTTSRTSASDRRRMDCDGL